MHFRGQAAGPENSKIRSQGDGIWPGVEGAKFESAFKCNVEKFSIQKKLKESNIRIKHKSQ